MAGLLTNANYINNTIKPAIKSAIEAQGVTVPSTDSFLDYADRIAEIEGGGSGYQLKDLPTGSISTVNDAAPLPLNALKVSVEAVQSGSGDPAPDNIRPIHGWDSGEISDVGKNFCPVSEGDFLAVATWVSLSNENANTFTNGTMVKLQAGTYTLSLSNVQNMDTLQIFDASGDDIVNTSSSLITFVLNSAKTLYIRLRRYSSGANLVFKIQIEEGSTATAWEPYQGKQYTLDFPQKIYGGSADLLNGVLSDNPLMEVFDDTATVTFGRDGHTNWYYTITSGQSANVASLPLSNQYVGAEVSNSNDTLGIQKLPNGYVRIRVGGAQPSSVNDFVAALGVNPLQVLTPITGATESTFEPIPTTKMLQGTNNIYADCGEVIEGEYFVDEGAIDVRKVDYQIGSSGSIKTTDGRVLSGFASMSGYHARPLDASGNWLDVDWSKDFEIGVAFKMTEYPSSNASQYIFGNGTNDLGYRFRTPRVYFSDYWQSLLLDMSLDGSSWYMDASVNFKPALNTWYFIRLKFDLQTLRITLDITTDFETYTTLHTEVLSSGLYHNGSALGIGGDQPTASDSTTDSFKVDTFNTYIKGDGVSWGASTGVFPS